MFRFSAALKLSSKPIFFEIFIQNQDLYYELNVNNHLHHILIISIVSFGILIEKLLRFRHFTFSCLLLVLFDLQLIAAQGNDALDKMKKKYLSAMFTKEMKTHRVYVYFLNILVRLDILTGCGYIQQMMLRKKHIAGQLLS